MTHAEHCTRCGLPAAVTKLGTITLQPNGVCNYCEFDARQGADFWDAAKHRQSFERRLEAIRGKYAYDVLVGISGGKDGAYVLHQMVTRYGLRVLAFTFDNEFLDDAVRDNVSKLAQRYGVDHVFIQTQNLRAFYRGCLRTVGVPCFACSTAGYYLVNRLLLEKRIPLAVLGRSPYQIFRNIDERAFQSDVFFALVRSNLTDYDPQRLRAIYAEAHHAVAAQLASLPLEQREKDAIYEEFFAPLTRLPEDFVPESYAYFLAEPYDEASMRATLRASGYVAPPSHEDCRIHNAACYLSSFPAGVAVDVLEAAVMRRRQAMDATEFAALLETRRTELRSPGEQIKQELTLMCQLLSLKEDEIAMVPRGPRP